MADKFLEKMELEEVWEMMKMTTLGEILLREGRKEGRSEGKNEKLADLISKKLAKGKTIAEIADALEETEDVIEQIIKAYNLQKN